MNSEMYSQEVIKDLIGKNYEDVVKLLVKKGITHRVAKKDSETFSLTQDMNPYRFNLVVMNNIVTEIKPG